MWLTSMMAFILYQSLLQTWDLSEDREQQIQVQAGLGNVLGRAISVSMCLLNYWDHKGLQCHWWQSRHCHRM